MTTEAEPTTTSPASAALRFESDAVLTLLVTSGYVDRERADLAIREAARLGDDPGEILVAIGAISESLHVAALSEVHNLQRVSLETRVGSPELCQLLGFDRAQALRVLPVASVGEEALVAVPRPLAPEVLAGLAELLGQPVRQLLVDRTELDQAIQRTWSAELSDRALHQLRNASPELSGHVVVTNGQKAWFAAIVLVTLGCLVVWPMNTLVTVVAVASAIYLAVSSYRFRLTLRALGTHLEVPITEDEIAALAPESLPIYTVLVPLYKEGAIVARLARDLAAIDYPPTRLDIKLLCEEDDVETIEIIRGLALPPQFHLVVVPDSLPKTKPKACNYGLQLAEGEICVIYDAEDRPDPDQLKKALIAFGKLPDNVVCIQAKLNYFNTHQNLLTSWFGNEYSMHFELVLPALAASDGPIPLGGTSNHFVTSVLHELGAWDPHNVTEDADLGIRLHRNGYRTAVIDSITLEEANSVVPNWIRQRSRWNKGYYQTWLVHMRAPLQSIRETGLRGFLSMNLNLGTAFVLLMNPIFWFLTTLYIATRWNLIEQLFPGPVFYMASAMLFIGNFLFLFINLAGSLHRGDFSLTRSALLAPLYWGLMSWAAWKGFLQLLTNPFYWEKTTHGLDSGSS